MKELTILSYGLAIVVVLLVARCSFTAIRYEEPDCAKCIDQCQVSK